MKCNYQFSYTGFDLILKITKKRILFMRTKGHLTAFLCTQSAFYCLLLPFCQLWLSLLKSSLTYRNWGIIDIVSPFF